MNASHRSARQLASKSGRLAHAPIGPAMLMSPCRSAKDSICFSCRETISRRRFASAAAAVQEPPANDSHVPRVSQAAAPQQAYQVRAGVVLSRPPVITRDLHPFEKAFFIYQRRLNERLALSFTRYFYFKKDTPSDIEWKRKQKQRLTAARDIGVYRAHGKEGWADELLIDAQESEPDFQRESLLKDMEVEGATGTGQGGKKADVIERPSSRVTEADKAWDQKSLNRMLQRTLYLLVKDGSGRWTFPQDRLIGRENLHSVGSHVLKIAFASADSMAGRGASAGPSRRRQHEHLDSRQPPRRTLPVQLPEDDPERREGCGGAGREGFLHEGTHDGGPGEAGGEQVRARGLQVAGEGGNRAGGDASVLERGAGHAGGAVSGAGWDCSFCNIRGRFLGVHFGIGMMR